jgi:hypothetical protein
VRKPVVRPFLRIGISKLGLFGFVLGLNWVCFGILLALIGFELGLFGFELGLFSPRPPSRLFSYPFVLTALMLIVGFSEIGFVLNKKG